MTSLHLLLPHYFIKLRLRGNCITLHSEKKMKPQTHTRLAHSRGTKTLLVTSVSNEFSRKVLIIYFFKEESNKPTLCCFLLTLKMYEEPFCNSQPTDIGGYKEPVIDQLVMSPMGARREDRTVCHLCQFPFVCNITKTLELFNCYFTFTSDLSQISFKYFIFHKGIGSIFFKSA